MTSSLRKICVFVGSRANYSSIKSVMRAVKAHPHLELQLIVGASSLLERYGSVVKLIEKDGFKANARVHMLVEGETPVTMAKSTGLGLQELPSVLEQLAPDYVITVGDRFETIATTLAAAFMNIRIVHTMGGEVSGTIDESIRHAVTKFAHIHFPACEEAKNRIIQLGENTDYIYQVGCPRIDLVAETLQSSPNDLESVFAHGVGSKFDLSQPFLMVSQHPVTTEYGCGEEQINETLKAISRGGLPAVLLWPNADAGSEDIAKGMRKWREAKQPDNLHFFKNLPTETYIHLLDRTACLIGNSSSGIREGAFIGVPVVNIGTRQQDRQAGGNVIHVPHNGDDIYDATMQQIKHGKYNSQSIYGEGDAGVKIANILHKCDCPVQKKFFDIRR